MGISGLGKGWGKSLELFALWGLIYALGIWLVGLHLSVMLWTRELDKTNFKPPEAVKPKLSPTNLNLKLSPTNLNLKP